MSMQKKRQVRIYGNNLAISGDPEQNWFIGWSPHHDAVAAEGSWQEWVQLAQAILNEEEKRLA